MSETVTRDNVEILLSINAQPKKKIITKYNAYGFILLSLALIFVVFLPVYIIVLAIIDGIIFKECGDVTYKYYWYNNDVFKILIPIKPECEDTVLPFIFELLIFPINGYYIYVLIKTLSKKGIELIAINIFADILEYYLNIGFVVSEGDKKDRKCQCFYALWELKNKIQRLIDCRCCAFKERPNIEPIEETIEFMYRSIGIIIFLNWMATIPTIVFNFATGNPVLRSIAGYMFFLGL